MFALKKKKQLTVSKLIRNSKILTSKRVFTGQNCMYIYRPESTRTNMVARKWFGLVRRSVTPAYVPRDAHHPMDGTRLIFFCIGPVGMRGVPGDAEAVVGDIRVGSERSPV